MKFVLMNKRAGEREKLVEKFRSCFGVKWIEPIQLIQSEIKEKSLLSQELLYHIENNQPFEEQMIVDLLV